MVLHVVHKYLCGIFYVFVSCRSCFLLKISGGNVTAIGWSGIEICLSHEPQKLEDYVTWQVCVFPTFLKFIQARCLGIK